jgi:CubicO group peptidase (beta-lactamase class C family)
LGIILLVIITLAVACEDEPVIITPPEGYSWPSVERSYWPTEEWIYSPPSAHDIDEERLFVAEIFAEADPLMRAVLLIKDGFLVYEKYFGDGGIDESTNLWSVTKSITSAAVGLAYDDDLIPSLNSKMADLMPTYPEFGDITLDHVMTHTTGLSWSEEGPLWVQWAMSDDWTREALSRKQVHSPGDKFYYSSANSHFLMSMVHQLQDKAPGDLLKTRLFDPMGIPFKVTDKPAIYSSWDDYKVQLDQSWHVDPQGTECGGFGLFLTARDMAKFGFLYLNRGQWENRQLLSEEWIDVSTKDQHTNVYGRYSYGYHWWVTLVSDVPVFLASGFGGQIIGVVPSLDVVVVLKYEADNPSHPVSGTAHDDMHLFELLVRAAQSEDIN